MIHSVKLNHSINYSITCIGVKTDYYSYPAMHKLFFITIWFEKAFGFNLARHLLFLAS